VEQSDEAESGSQRVVLFDTAHDNRFLMTELASLTGALSAQGAQIEVFGPSDEFDELGLSGRLKFADAFVVVTPFDSFSRREVTDITSFVERGGRLLVMLDPTRASSGADIFGFVLISPSDDVASANQLLEKFDLSFTDDYLYDLLENEGNFRNVMFSDFADSQLTQDLETVVLYATRSVSTVSGSPLLLAEETTLSSSTDLGGDLAAAALAENANVLAIGDLTFLTAPYDRVADNRQFIHNLVAFLLGGERVRDLLDLPFVFSGPVSVVQSSDFAIQAETLLALQSMEAFIRGSGSEFSFPEDLPDEGDRLILGLFEPDETLEDVIGALGLTLPIEDPDGKLNVPGFGGLNPAGLGLIGLQHDEGGATLLLLAEDHESVVALLETVGSGLLQDCLLQGSYGLCQVGEGDGFDEASDFEFDLNLDSEAEQSFSD
jgi:hypothetical protein